MSAVIEPDRSFTNRYRGYYKRIKDKGVYLSISGAEPAIPENLLEKYPEMKNQNNMKFWKFIEEMIEGFFLLKTIQT